MLASYVLPRLLARS